MQWTQLEQKEIFLENRTRPNGGIYKDQLLILGNGLEPESMSKPKPESKLKLKSKSSPPYRSEAYFDERAQYDSDYDSDDSADNDLPKSVLHSWNISISSFIFPSYRIKMF